MTRQLGAAVQARATEVGVVALTRQNWRGSSRTDACPSHVGGSLHVRTYFFNQRTKLTKNDGTGRCQTKRINTSLFCSFAWLVWKLQCCEGKEATTSGIVVCIANSSCRGVWFRESLCVAGFSRAQFLTICPCLKAILR